MKLIRAIIRPEKLSDVRTALEKAECYKGITITDVVGQGIQKGIIQAWRGEKYEIDLVPKVSIDLVVPDKDVEKIKKIIVKTAQTGEIGDGKIFVSSVDEVVRIRTGEEGEGAV